MTTTRGSSGRQRGRPRAFDTDAVLDASIDMFWREGFQRVTTRSLETSIGISQSSIYNTFGSKEGLFTRAKERYQQRFNQQILTLLTSGEQPEEVLPRFVDALVDWIGHPDHPGCLMVNYLADSGELTDRLDYEQHIRMALAALQDTAIRSDNRIGGIDVFLASWYGLCLLARTGAPPDQLRLVGQRACEALLGCPATL